MAALYILNRKLYDSLEDVEKVSEEVLVSDLFDDELRL